MGATGAFDDDTPITQADIDAGHLVLRTAGSDGPPVARTPAEAVQVLRERCTSDEISKYRPLWHDIALKLADHNYMTPAWRVLLKQTHNPYIVVNAAESAYKAACQDVWRPSTTEEKEQLKRVRDAATELKRAVEAAPLPAMTGIPLESLSPALMFGWKGDTQQFDKMAQFWSCPAALLLTDLMTTVELLVDQHVGNLPPRAIFRDESPRSDPRLTAFVRHLTWQMNVTFGSGMPSPVGRIAATLFDLPRVLGKKQVEKKLDHQPEPFSAERARTFHAKIKAAEQAQPKPPEGDPL